MLVSTATLCDFAQVREGLLFVMSGGITRLTRPELPAPMGVMIALVVDLDPEECRNPHTLKVVVMDEDGGEIAKAEGQFSVNRDDSVYQVGEVAHVNIALPLGPAMIQKYGAHAVHIYIDGTHQRSWTFWVARPPLAQAS